MKANRVIAAIAVAGLIGGVGYLGQVLDVASIQIGSQPEAQTLQVNAKNLAVACPGSAIRLGGTNGVKVEKLDRFGTAQGVASTNLKDQQELSTLSLATGSLASSVASGSRDTFNFSSSQGTKFTVVDPNANAEQSSALLAASQFEQLSGSSNGLLGANCVAPSSDQWLLSAETTTGREALLILENASSIAATVDLEIYTEGGKMQGSGLNGISVAAQSSEVIPLASLSPKTNTMALHITSRGGLLTSWVQQKTQRGTQSGGADFITATQQLSTKIAIPALLIRGAANALHLASENPEYLDLYPSLDIFVPGETQANFTAQVLGSNEKSYGTVIHDVAKGERITKFALEGLEDGDYSVVIDSDQPIRAQVSFSWALKNSAPDFAYASPAEPLTGVRGGVTASNADSWLSVLNPNDEPVEVSVTLGSKTQTFTLEKYSSRLLPAAKASYVSLDSKAGVAASIVSTRDGQVTTTNLVTYRNIGGQISVLVR